MVSVVVAFDERSEDRVDGSSPFIESAMRCEWGALAAAVVVRLIACIGKQ